MGAVIGKPVVVEVPTGRDIVIFVEGKPVVFIRHNETREVTGSGINNDLTYLKHEYTGMGITVKDEAKLNYQFVGECANTMALDVTEQTLDGVIDGINKRWYAKKK